MIYWNDDTTIDVLQKVLNDNQVVLASGDTVLGLWGNVTPIVFEKINMIKQRHDKPYLLVIDSIEKLPRFINQEFTEQIQNLVRTCWPGPVTLIFKANPSLPAWIKSPDGTIAVRVPDHNGLRSLLKHYDALFSTSANIHGQPIPESISSIDRRILGQVGAVCIDRGQQVYPQSPSTILNCSSGSIELVRTGAFNIELIRSLLG